MLTNLIHLVPTTSSKSTSMRIEALGMYCRPNDGYGPTELLDFGLFTYSQARLLNLLLLEIQLRLDGFPCVSQVPTDGQHSFPSPHLGQALGGSPPVGVGA